MHITLTLFQKWQMWIEVESKNVYLMNVWDCVGILRTNYLWLSTTKHRNNLDRRSLCKLCTPRASLRLYGNSVPARLNKMYQMKSLYLVSWVNQAVTCKLQVGTKIQRYEMVSSKFDTPRASCSQTKERMTCSTKLLIADRRLRGNPGEEDFWLKISSKFTLFTRIKTSCLRCDRLFWNLECPTEGLGRSESTTGRCSERKWLVYI